MARFEETGSLHDLEHEILKQCIYKIHRITIADREDRFKSLNLFELAVHSEYMRRNMGAHDPIVYEGAIKEYLLPELIFRITEHLDVRALVAGLLES